MPENLDLLVIIDAPAPWFDYIWQEFIRISGAEFSWCIEVASNEQQSIPAAQPVLEYTRFKRIDGSYHIPASEQVFYDDDISSSLTGTGQYDLLFTAFARLSRIEEWHAHERGQRIESYASRHPRKIGMWQLPVVNLIFEQIANRLRELWPHLKFAEFKKPVFELSHDLDYLYKTPQLRFKQTLFGLWNSLKCLKSGEFTLAGKRVWNSIRFTTLSSDYWNFDYWEALEKSYEVSSVYYVYAYAVGTKGTWLIDPTYRLGNQTKLVEKLRQLRDEGFEIGLHGSYKSATDGELLRREKETLENLMGHTVEKTRQHWLRYDEGITPYIHEKLFQYDSTLGWNDVPGFRNGCASRFRPYDHRNQRPFEYFETPMVLMDSHLFDYAPGKEHERLADVLLMLDQLKTINFVHVAINWHPHTCHSDYNWHVAYETVLKNVA
jgi:hypothetical protein